jgi:Arc/MetJ family transcription regulator
MLMSVIFKEVGDTRPYPGHNMTMKDWVKIEPQELRLDHLVTTKRMLDLSTLLAEDSTLYGDLFPHVISWNGNLYLEDGLQRTLRAALQGRQTIHARVLEMAGPGIQ